VIAQVIAVNQPQIRRVVAPSPGLEPELSEPKSDVLPITPRRTTHQRRADLLAVGRSRGRPRTLMPSSDCSATDNLVGVAAPEKEVRPPRARMTGSERRHQLIDIARSLFAERGYEGTSIEEIALRANVSKPVVYEHFGGKEGLYAVVVDREMSALLDGITSSLTNNRSRVRVERVALALLTYVEERTDGFRIMIRDSPAAISSGTYSSLLNDAVSQVASILAGDFARRGLDPGLAPLYAQALVGSVSMTAQWWLDTREPKKEVVAAHLVNLMWNGLTHLEADPHLQDE
jgi:AcrR family transcriptional regulator